MWSPPALENNRQLWPWRGCLRPQGTQLLSSDFARGFFLMEDWEAFICGRLSVGCRRCSHTAAIGRYRAGRFAYKIFLTQTFRPTTKRMTMEFDLCAEWFAQKLIQSPPGPADASTLADAARAWCMRCLNSPQPAFTGIITAAICCCAAKQANRTRSAWWTFRTH